MSGMRPLCFVASLTLTLSALPVAAQWGVAVPEGSDPSVLYCYDAGLTRCSDDSACASPATCRPEGVCAGPEMLLCRLDGFPDARCPGDTEFHSVFGVDICIPPRALGLCEGSLDCLQAPGGVTSTMPTAWERGDCDGDLLENGRDPQPCVVPPTIGLVDPRSHGCEPASRPCERDADCADELLRTLCRAVSPRSSAHKYCVETDVPGLCCGESLVCGNDATCDPAEGDDFDVCHLLCKEPAYAYDYEERLRCILDPDDDTVIVALPDGDCDEDEHTNREEEVATTDACDNESTPPEEPDAGAPADGGASAFDAGTDPVPPSVQPMFGGGGGCRCRAGAPSSSGAAPWALGLLALFALRRRRQ